MQWANKMVTSWACALTGDRCIAIVVVLDNCRSVAVGVDVGGVEIVNWQGRLNKLRIKMMMGSSLLTTGVGGRGVGRMLGVSGGSSAPSPSRSVQSDWMASILLGGVSWMLAMAAASLVVALMILLVAVISGTGLA